MPFDARFEGLFLHIRGLDWWSPVILLDWTSIGLDLDGLDLAGLDPEFEKFGLDWIETSGGSWSANGLYLIRKY